MNRSRNTGDSGVPGLTLVDTTLAQDLAAFDQLGPKTRAVIDYEMAVKWSAAATLRYAREVMRVDPIKDDAKIAEMLKQANATVVAKVRV
jgi:hypothetical protein